MEPLLINRFRMNRENVLRSSSEGLRTARILDVVFAALLLCAGIYAAIACFRAEEPDYHLILRPVVLLGLAVFLTVEAITVAKRNTDRFMKRLQSEFGTEDCEFVIRFYADFFTTESSSRPEPRRREYGSVSRIIRGKQLLHIGLEGSSVGDLDPARFENGTEADFWRLMNEKCPKAVPKKYRV